MTQARVQRITAGQPAAQSAKGRLTERKPATTDRVNSLGDPDRLAAVSVGTTPSQRTANDLIAAERALAEAQSRYLGARRAWTDAVRHSAADKASASRAAAAQTELDAADAARSLALRRIDELRQQLHDQRHRELLVAAIATQEVAHNARRQAEVPKKRSFLARLFGRK
jgi:hypothetical protein